MKLNVWGKVSNFEERKQEENKKDVAIMKDLDAEKKIYEETLISVM